MLLTALCVSRVIFQSGQFAPHRHGQERKIFLRPGAIKFHLVALRHALRAHIADHADNFSRHAAARGKQDFPDRIFVPENFARAGLANQHHILMIHEIMLVEIASGEQRNAPGLK